jgi:hypothetical protein
MPRAVAAEALDHLAPADLKAQRSRRDLLRVHVAMGTRPILCRAWQALVPSSRAQLPLRILEIGAGDGRLLLGVARMLAARWPQVQLTLLDRQDLVSADTLAAYAALGWTATRQVTDVLDWAAGTQTAAQRWDLISASLFLHHFTTEPLSRLLSAVAARTDRFVACEPRRAWPALVGSHLVGALGANAVTRADAVLSVHAGFRAQELTACWPGRAEHWQTQDQAAGLFLHQFSARRARVRM